MSSPKKKKKRKVAILALQTRKERKEPSGGRKYVVDKLKGANSRSPRRNARSIRDASFLSSLNPYVTF
jgi:hypothetical protein